MKSASANLIALLNTATECFQADLYTFTLAGGSVYRFTNAVTDLVAGAYTFSSAGPLITRSSIRTVVGVQVDSLDVTLMADENVFLNGIPWLKAIANGALDGAYLKMERAYMPTWADLVNGGTIIQFSGRVSEIVVTRTNAQIKVNSDLELLNIKMPRNMYQPGCVHTLYDSGCAVARASFTSTASITSTSTTSTINASALTQAANYFSMGVITFTSGANAGLSRTVKSFSAGVVGLSYPLPNVPSIGDGFGIVPGCDKMQATCSGKFANLANFRGFPFVPVPETAY